MLDREQLYLTDVGKSACEAAARANMSHEWRLAFGGSLLTNALGERGAEEAVGGLTGGPGAVRAGGMACMVNIRPLCCVMLCRGAWRDYTGRHGAVHFRVTRIHGRAGASSSSGSVGSSSSACSRQLMGLRMGV